jgi:hypothetical protein
MQLAARGSRLAARDSRLATEDWIWDLGTGNWKLEAES